MILTDNLYNTIQFSENKAEIIFSNEDHIVFKSHFPNNPILPGFLQIDIACELFNLKIKKIKKAKFLKILKPNDICTYNLSHNKITIFHNAKKISEITYE